MKKYSKIAIVVLCILYFVGIVGFLNPTLRELVLPLTPINLLLTLLVPLFFQKDLNAKLVVVLAIVAVLGFSAEVVGVATGKVFGEYQYGKTLGLKYLAVPLIIGINWASLVYSSSSLVSKFKIGILAKSLIAAALMTGLDYLMEPIAIKYDFWHWKNDTIPLQNYLAWFLIAFALLLFFHKFIKLKTNTVAIWAMVLQFLFFGILQILG
jgi:bisanhydrobacterioruberin hydratase